MCINNLKAMHCATYVCILYYTYTSVIAIILLQVHVYMYICRVYSLIQLHTKSFAIANAKI